MHSNTDWREEEVRLRLFLARLLAGSRYQVVPRTTFTTIADNTFTTNATWSPVTGRWCDCS